MCPTTGEVDLFTWHCKIPGPAGSIWEGGLYPLDLKFTENYPAMPPECYFPKNFYHPNVYPSGKVQPALPGCSNLSACIVIKLEMPKLKMDLLSISCYHRGFWFACEVKSQLWTWACPALWLGQRMFANCQF